MDQLSHKVCKKCGVDKPLSEYYTNVQMVDGHVSECKLCVRARTKARKCELRAGQPEREPSPTYAAIHLHLLAHFPKTGACENCGRSARTQHALIHGREYSRNREDYRELCSRCHVQYDHGGERHYASTLTADQVAEIKARYTPRSRGPNGSRALAVEFEVHPNTIWNIATGQTWNNPEGEPL